MNATKVAPAGVQKLNPNNYVGPGTSQVSPTVFIAHGPPGSGKTTLGGSMSRYWPGHRPAGPERLPVFLKDTVFMMADPDGMASLYAAGVDAPQVNLVKLLEEMSFRKMLAVLPELVTFTLTKYPEADRLVVDTLTGLDEEAQSACNDIQDKRQFYGGVLELHRQFVAVLRAMPFRYMLLNCHSKPFSSGETAESKLQATALRMAGGGAIVPAIVGQGLSRYQRMASIQVAMLANTLAGKTSYVLRSVALTDGFQAKNRYAGIVKAEEAPDLRSIIDRIEGLKASLAPLNRE